MSKRDRQGVRTAADIERKYDLGKLDAFRGDSQKQGIVVSELTQKVDQFIANTNGDIGDINGEIADINERLNNIGPAISPTIDFTVIEGGHRVILTDANGVETFDVMNGKDGEDGKDGTGGSGNTQVSTNNVLWSGVEQMGTDESFALAQPVSEQMTGIVLIFSFYMEDLGARDYRFHTFFVSKYEVANHSWQGHQFTLFSPNFENAASKYIYIADSYIKGNTINIASGTGSGTGIPYNNKNFVLRYVIGV